MFGVLLPPYGYAVRLARNGTEAVELYRRHRDDIDLVLLDVQMGGLDGPHTLAALQAVNPEVRCVFMSGHTGVYSAEDLRAMGAADVIGKPFRNLDELTET